MRQTERVQRYIEGESPPPVRLSLDLFAAVEGAREVLSKVRGVMHLVADAQAGHWHEDGEWKHLLPPWFVRTFDGHSLDELLADPSLWDFGSWLDAMKSPGWEWWSCQETGFHGRVLCTAHSDPYSIEPLIYLMRAAGGEQVTFREGA